MKDKPEETLSGIDALLAQIEKLRSEYEQLCHLEDAFVNTLKQRLNHIR